MSIDQKLDKLMDEVSAIKSKLSTVGDNVTDLKKAVFGNGRKGLTDRMTALEHEHSSLKNAHLICPAREAISGSAKRQSAANLVAGIALVVSVITSIIAIVK